MEGENVFWAMTRRMDMHVKEVEQLKIRMRRGREGSRGCSGATFWVSPRELESPSVGGLRALSVFL